MVPWQVPQHRLPFKDMDAAFCSPHGGCDDFAISCGGAMEPVTPLGKNSLGQNLSNCALRNLTEVVHGR